MSLEENQTSESPHHLLLTPVSISRNGSGTPDDDIIRRRKSYPKTSPRHTEIFRKSMQIDDLSLRQKFRLHLRLKRAGDEASKEEETAKEKEEVDPSHDDNKIGRYAHILKVQSGISALTKWKVKTKTTETPEPSYRTLSNSTLDCNDFKFRYSTAHSSVEAPTMGSQSDERFSLYTISAYVLETSPDTKTHQV